MARNFLVDRIGVLDVPLKVDFFSLNLHFHIFLSFKFSAWVKLLLMHLAKAVC